MSRTCFLATRVCRRAGAVVTVLARSSTARSPPRTAAASRRQTRRWSASERGSCLASRVSKVACWASLTASIGVGGRPWSAWNWTARAARRVSMAARRDDQAVVSSSGIPTISRTLRRPAAAAAEASERSVKVRPSRACSCDSRRVLYRSEEVTVALNSTRPSRASHRPGVPSALRTRTLLETATWVCRSGSPARESRCSNAAARTPVVSRCCTPACPPRVDRLLLEPADGVLHGGAVCSEDLVGDVLGGDRPQCGDALDGGERQVVPGDRVGGLAGVAGNEGGQLPRAARSPAVLLGEHARPTSVRILARSAAANGVSRGSSRALFAATARRATSTRNAGAVSRMSYGLPSSVAARAACRCAAVLPNVIIWARIASAFGCKPSANRAAIWSSVTSSPTCMSTSARADPNQVPHHAACSTPRDRCARGRCGRAPRPAGSGTRTRPRRSACESTPH